MTFKKIPTAEFGPEIGKVNFHGKVTIFILKLTA